MHLRESVICVFSAMMGDFTNSEKADLHPMYDAANGIGRAALRLYQERFPNGRMPNHKMFERLHRHFVKMVHSSPALTEQLKQELFDIQTRKKPS
ncbi:hypothetical protein AVEN_167938-1 [Araneus ventricosus]|uniref:DUF4817 domain-containing protein n=1 Tax=Araneus ventricosus TaxID=182803 RepID=A0A4Y2NXL0_ARAVE|nr:hypothetical protein AVEN_167938-1 [Araneus ventricosus]